MIRFRNSMLIIAIHFAIAVLCVATNVAQERGDGPSGSESAEGSQERLDDKPSEEWLEPRILSLGPYGMTRWAGGHWGGVAIQIVNPNDEDAKIYAASHIQELTGRQFGREFWVPANSVYAGWYPIHIPLEGARGSELGGETERGNLLVEFDTWLFDQSKGKDSPVRRITGEMTYSDSVLLEETHRLAGVYFDEEMDGVEKFYASEALSEILARSGRKRRARPFTRDRMPSSQFLLDQYGTLLIAGDSFAEDSALTRALHDWIVRGGRVWIMLDQVSQDSVEKLLGEACVFETIDEVAINEVDLQLLSNDGELVIQSHTQFHEDPVRWVQVMPGDAQVSVKMDEWPALFWLKLGRGRVMVTTVEARAWLVQKQADERGKIPIDVNTNSISDVLYKMSTAFFDKAGSAEESSPDLTRFASEQVGYRIMPQWAIASLMAGYFLILIGVGVFLARTDRMRLLVWTSPILALLMAGGLVAFAQVNRGQIETTLVEVQYVEIGPNSDTFDIDGTMSVYVPEPLKEPLRGDSSVYVVPELSGIDSTTLRWNADAEWTYEARIGPGADQYQYRSIERSNEPIHAVAHFEGGELVGEVVMPGVEGIEDPILATSRGLMAGKSSVNKEFRIESLNVLGDDEFFATTVVTSQQQRRKQIYQQLLGDSREWNRFEAPTLFFWNRAWSSGLTDESFARKIDSSIVSIPVTLRPPPPGTKVSLSTPWFEMETRAKQGGVASLYSPRLQEWIESNKKTQVVIAYRLPDSVKDLQAEAIRIALEINCPDRPFRLYLLTERNEIDIHDSEGMIGKLELDITDDAPQAINRDGEFLLGLDVGDYTGSAEANDWRIIDLNIEIDGETSAGD